MEKSSDQDAKGEGMFEQFKQLAAGFKACLGDIWSLEINTSVVSEIGGYKFNPISCYESIYSLPDDLDSFQRSLHLEEYQKLLNPSNESTIRELQDKIRNELKASKLPSYVIKVFTGKMLPAEMNDEKPEPETLENLITSIKSYILIKERLRRSYYALVLTGSHVPGNDVLSARVASNPQVESQGGRMVDEREARTGEDGHDVQSSSKANEYPLPNLDNAIRDGLLDNSTFLRDLRSLRELYYLVGGQEATDSTTVNDLIAAQTIIQMDGDVMNRFHKALLNEPEKEFLIQTHQKALSTGQENWKNLINLIIESLHTLSGFLKRSL